MKGSPLVAYVFNMRERDRQTDILKEMRNRKGMYKVMDKERKKIKSEAEKEDAGETNRKVNEKERETNDKWSNEIQV